MIGSKIVDTSKGVYGHVDSIDSRGISGWILDLDGGVNAVEVYINGVKVAEKEANLPRQDIDAIVGKTTNCGFFISWKDVLVRKEVFNTLGFKLNVLHKRTMNSVAGKYNYNNMLELHFQKKGDKSIEDLQNGDIIKYIFDEDKKIVFKINNDVLVSIIIPCHNKWEYTYRCLKSVYENTDLEKVEIIIADDNSSDETINIGRYIKGVKVIKNIPALGFLKNCNQAVQLARGKYIVLLNNDTEVKSGWLEYLLKTIESDERIGLVGPKLVFPDGTLQEAGGIIWNDASGWNFGRGDDPEKSEYNYVKEVDYISGACILVRKELWEEIGGFDERYAPAYFEDSDLAFEIRKRGYKVVYQPKAVVVHYEGISHGTDTSHGIKRYQEINRPKFIDKWKYILEKEHLPNGVNPFLARDRTIYKKHILIIDHYFPEPDKDAGSRTMFLFTKLFKELGFHVIFISDNFFRSEPYTTNLQQLGVEAIYGPEYAKDWKTYLARILKYIDIIFLSRSWISYKYLEFLREIKAQFERLPKIIYYPHDLSYIRAFREYKLTGESKFLEEYQTLQKKENYIIEHVDTLILLSTTEQNIVEKEFNDKNILIIPPFLYEGPFPLSSNNKFLNRRGIFFIGGFRHRPNYYGVKWFIENCWVSVKKELEDIEFFIAGSEIPEDIKSLSKYDMKIKVLGHLTDEQLKNLYDNVRVVIVPLTVGAGVKGKVIEAIAHGVPIVTTSVGAEGIENIEDVLLIADKPEDFVRSIINLYTNEQLWNEKRKKMIDYSRKHLSINKGKKVMLELVNELLKEDYGYCTVCGNYTSFEKTSDNLRETYICRFCGSISRNRHLAKILTNHIGNVPSLADLALKHKHLSIYEVASYGPVHKILSRHPNYVCSEYHPDKPCGSLISKGVYNQDLQQLSFGDCSFDIVITQDILEHVRDPWKAFKEIHRVLKPEGLHIFTIPYHKDKPTTKRVDTSGTEDVFLLPPVYHDDPMNPKGALVYTDFGYDLVDTLKDIGFETNIYWSTEEDAFENKIFWNVVFVSRKL